MQNKPIMDLVQEYAAEVALDERGPLHPSLLNYRDKLGAWKHSGDKLSKEHHSLVKDAMSASKQARQASGEYRRTPHARRTDEPRAHLAKHYAQKKAAMLHKAALHKVTQAHTTLVHSKGVDHPLAQALGHLKTYHGYEHHVHSYAHESIETEAALLQEIK